MKTTMTSFFILLLFNNISKAQLTPVDVADLTLKVGGLESKTLMYGFAEGDQILFNFSEVDNKELKELEITEYPSNSKFMDYKTTKIENKTISVIKKGVYTFRFANSAIGGRVCRIKIQRIPAKAELANFNTSVETKTFYDTTWATKSKVIVERVDTIPELVLDKQGEIVHVAANEHGAYSDVEVILPPHTAYWTYWIGVGEGSQQSFSSAQQKMVTGSLKYLGMADPLAALAVGGISYLIAETAVDNLAYKIRYNQVVDGVQQTVVFHDGGDIVKPDYALMTPPRAPKEGYMYFNLYNDNTIDPIQVYIKVMAIKIIPIEKIVQYKEATVTTKQKPVIVE
jgi:hypothetical protein